MNKNLGTKISECLTKHKLDAGQIEAITKDVMTIIDQELSGKNRKGRAVVMTENASAYDRKTDKVVNKPKVI